MSNKLDPSNMYDAVWDFPNNLTDAYELGKKIEFKKNYSSIQSIVIADPPMPATTMD